MSRVQGIFLKCFGQKYRDFFFQADTPVTDGVKRKGTGAAFRRLKQMSLEGNIGRVSVADLLGTMDVVMAGRVEN